MSLKVRRYLHFFSFHCFLLALFLLLLVYGYSSTALESAGLLRRVEGLLLAVFMLECACLLKLGGTIGDCTAPAMEGAPVRRSPRERRVLGVGIFFSLLGLGGFATFLLARLKPAAIAGLAGLPHPFSTQGVPPELALRPSLLAFSILAHLFAVFAYTSALAIHFQQGKGKRAGLATILTGASLVPEEKRDMDLGNPTPGPPAG